jgi:hypothetical protein
MIGAPLVGFKITEPSVNISRIAVPDGAPVVRT